MGDSIENIKIGDVIEVRGGEWHTSMHIVIGSYVEEGDSESGIADEKMFTTYAFYCHDTQAKHLEINKIWNMPLENYLSRSSHHLLRIIRFDKN
jgi:acyl-CoA hydrolase